MGLGFRVDVDVEKNRKRSGRDNEAGEKGGGGNEQKLKDKGQKG
jgi:hypothetical protein